MSSQQGGKRQKSYDHLTKAEKAVEDIQHPLMITAFSEIGRKLVNSIYEIDIVTERLNHETWKTFLHISHEARMSNLTTLIQHSIGSSSQYST